MRFVCTLNSRRFTGLLHVVSGDRRLSFSFRDGNTVFVQERTGGVFRSQSSVAQQLVRQRILTPEQYTAVVERMEGVIAASVDASFCDIAVRLRYLEPRQVYEAFTERIRSRMMEAVAWRQCALAVDDSPTALSGHERFPVAPLPLLYRAIRNSYDQQRVFDCCSLNPQDAVRPAGPAVTIAHRFGLDQEELRFLEACDGATPAALLVEQSGLDPLHAWQLLCLLDLSASLKAAGREDSGTASAPAKSAPSARAGAYSRPVSAVERLAADLRMRRSAKPPSAPSDRPTSRGQSERARSVSAHNLPAMESLARELAKRKSLQPPSAAPGATNTRPPTISVGPLPGSPRSTSPRPPPASVRPLAGQVRPSPIPGGFSRPVSNRPGSARPPGARSARPHSETSQRRSRIDGLPKRPAGGKADANGADRAVEVFESGKSYLWAKDFESARDEFLLAHELEPRQGVYRMYYLWAALRAESTGGPIGYYPKELKRLAHSHTCIHGHIGFAYFVLGQLELSDGNERTAERHFKAAIENDPDQPEALRQYRLLVKRRKRR